MRVAVTGAAGFIGSHLISALWPEHQIIAVDNERSGNWARVRQPVERHDLDIARVREQEWADLLSGTEVVFHLAAEKYNSSASSPQRVIDVNVSATACLFRGAARAGVRKIVFTSSLYAYGQTGPGPMRESDILTPDTYYGMSKAAGESLLRVVRRDHGTAWACARLFFIYGPRQYAEGGYKSVILRNFERMLVGEAPRLTGSGDQRLDYVFVDDAVEALIRLAAPEHDSATVNVGTGRGVSIRELTALMSDIAGSPLAPVQQPPDWTEGTVRVADPRFAQERLGWQATTPLQSGLLAVWDWLSKA